MPSFINLETNHFIFKGKVTSGAQLAKLLGLTDEKENNTDNVNADSKQATDRIEQTPSDVSLSGQN